MRGPPALILPSASSPSPSPQNLRSGILPHPSFPLLSLLANAILLLVSLISFSFAIMGCAESKLEDSEVVVLCRERTLLLTDAIRHRYALADAHAAYSRSIGVALHIFLHGGPAVPPGSPVLPLPTHRKGDPLLPLSVSPPRPPSPPLPPATPTRSHCGSHIQVRSSEDSDEDDDFHLHSDGGVYQGGDDGDGDGFGGDFLGDRGGFLRRVYGDGVFLGGFPSHAVFGIASSTQLWPRRREFLRLWWHPRAMRGHVWLDDRIPRPRNASLARALPPIRLSEDISSFRYTNPTGHPSGHRLGRRRPPPQHR